MIISCQSQNYEEAFVAQYSKRQFFEFMNLLISFRSFDENGNRVFFLHHLNSNCEAAFIVTIRENSNRILKIDNRIVKKKCSINKNLDLATTQSIFDEFLKIKVNSIMVSEDSIVKIELYEASKYNLIRVPSSKSNNRFDESERLNDYWYKVKK